MQNAAVLTRARRSLAAAVVVLAATLPACDTGPQTAASVDLAVPTTSILVGQTVQITATVKDKSGKTLLNRPILYQTTAPTIVSVSGEGLVLGVTPGTGAITAKVDAVTQSLSFVVSKVPVARVAMSRDTATVRAATTLQLTATPQDSAGHTLTDRAVTWSSSDQAIATVSATGLVSALAPGTATITATSEGKSGTTRITVTTAAIATIDVTPSSSNVPEGSTRQLTATVKDALGHVLTGRTLTWTSSDVNKATVDSTGLVHAVAPGVANILATAEGIVGGAAVLVTPVVIGSVTVSPHTATVAMGGTVQLSATVKDTAGTVITFKPVTWSTRDTAIARVDSTGLVTSVAPGTVRIVATRDAAADSATITVTPIPVASLRISPAPAHLAVARSGRLAVTLFDAAGNVLTGRKITYTVSNPALATVDTSGLFTGVAAGTTDISLSSGGASGSTQLIVETTPVATVVTDPTSIAFTAIGATKQINVTVKDAAANALGGRMVTFTSADPTIATVSNTGLVRAIKAGNTNITVVSEGIIASVNVTVP